MHIIIGLGNPGKKYESTRHNAGFAAIDALAAKFGFEWKNSKKLKAEIAAGQGFVLVKPQTFMNDSGLAAAAVLSFFHRHLAVKNADLSGYLTVIHDDLDIEFGKYRISINSRSAGHKGAESVIAALQTKNFKRIRIGIKNQESREKIPAQTFVLQKFNKLEKNITNEIIKKIINQEIKGQK